jgi:hypothetical protein
MGGGRPVSEGEGEGGGVGQMAGAKGAGAGAVTLYARRGTPWGDGERVSAAPAPLPRRDSAFLGASAAL